MNNGKEILINYIVSYMGALTFLENELRGRSLNLYIVSKWKPFAII